MKPLAPVLLALLLAGCAAPGGTVAPAGGQAAEAAPFSFLPSVVLSTEGAGYEPSVEVDRDGAVYVTAAAWSGDRGAQLASWLWRSADGGATWAPLPSPLDAQRRLPGLEGDLALDGEGRLYFVDTYAADMTLSRWAPGPTWEESRPVVGTLAVDDRPWLAAHGDGVAYLLVNNGPALPAPGNLAEQPTGSRLWLHVSEDKGLTWSAPHGFPSSLWCTVAADPADDRHVLVACSRLSGTWTVLYFGLVTGTQLVAYESFDRGATWEETILADAADRYDLDMTPVVAFEADGGAVVAWSDDARSRLMLATRPAGGAWAVADATPFAGRFEEPWACGGATTGVVFYAATRDEPDAWRAYGMLRGEDGAWAWAPVDPEPAARGEAAPGDFLQCAVDAEGALHVAYHREPPPDPSHVGVGVPGQVRYARSVPWAGTSA